jgi:hypothetical protein
VNKAALDSFAMGQGPRWPGHMDLEKSSSSTRRSGIWTVKETLISDRGRRLALIKIAQTGLRASM